MCVCVWVRSWARVARRALHCAANDAHSLDRVSSKQLSSCSLSGTTSHVTMHKKLKIIMMKTYHTVAVKEILNCCPLFAKTDEQPLAKPGASLTRTTHVRELLSAVAGCRLVKSPVNYQGTLADTGANTHTGRKKVLHNVFTTTPAQKFYT